MLNWLKNPNKEEKPLTDSDLRSWGASHITKAFGPSWASLGYDSENKIIDLIDEKIQDAKSKEIFSMEYRNANVTVIDGEFYSICLLNGSVITFFPKAESESVYEVELLEIHEVGNLFEAFAEIKIGPAKLFCFITDYFEHKEQYRKGNKIRLAIGGIAFNCEESDIAQRKFRGRDGKELMLSEDFAGTFPGNAGPASYAVSGKIAKKKELMIGKEKAVKFTIQMLHQPDIFMDAIGIEKYCKLPKNGSHAFSNVWMQLHFPENNLVNK